MMAILKNLRGRKAPLNVRDLAKLLDVTEGTIQRWVRRRQVPAIRVGDVIRFDPGMLAKASKDYPASTSDFCWRWRSTRGTTGPTSTQPSRR